ncbi:MAG TPA: carboxylating nicotinate-nucleotide diphosphorylase [Candidatus Omnitrophota bacterium]|nr:carboxylating nicotinate-nucleotide diphosphorylase [Candidatus Omnitrophota bacterium]
MPLNNALVKKIVKDALIEDAAGRDITSLSFIPKDVVVDACIVAKEDGVVCGVSVAEEVFKSFDRLTVVSKLKKDANSVHYGEKVLIIKGQARSILSCERVALNFISYLSGISTQTHAAVSKAAKKGIRILDTRKTTPLLRVFEKYAVLTGGGKNHRLDLSDQYLVKENHLSVIDRTCGHEVFLWRKKSVPFEIEVQSLDELKRALVCQPDIVMLDNFSPADIRFAISLLKKIFPDRKKRPMIELSGGINLENISKYLISGVDFISLGSLTHSARALDFSLDILKVKS